MMHTLSLYFPSPIPTLYVRSLSSYGGPEYSIQSIFRQARTQAPCLLVFEDLDSLVTDNVRSYFLNEVDGLESNDGILMVGSTNHLERLDPGIRKRPSRFDRKFFFGLPDMEERILYCEFWRRKLGADGDDDNDDDDDGGETDVEKDPEVEFPQQLCKAIAGITAGFSFAYIQEAFVASLLAIAASEEEGANGRVEGQQVNTSISWDGRYCTGDPDSDFDQFILWREMKVQVQILREELDDGDTHEMESILQF